MSDTATQLQALTAELLRLSECAKANAATARTNPEQYVAAVSDHFLQLIPMVAGVRKATAAVERQGEAVPLRYFAYDSDNGNYNEFSNLTEAVADAQEALDYAGDDGWPDGGPTVVYGTVLGEAREVEGSRRPRGPNDNPDFDFIVDYELTALVPPPAAPSREAACSREWAVKIAQAAAYASHHTHGYLPRSADEAHHWQPHEWVIDAIRAAALDAPPEQPTDTPAAVPNDFVEACDKSDWTPEEALHFYAQGRHFDTPGGRTRILDTGAIASLALKNSSPEYWAAKGGEAIGHHPTDTAEDDRFPSGLADAIAYADAAEEAAADLYLQVMGYESDASGTAIDMLRDVSAHLKQPTDTERLDYMASEYLSVEPFDMPTPGGDDADVGWRVVRFQMGKVREVVVAVVCRDDPRAAIDAAMKATGEGS